MTELETKNTKTAGPISQWLFNPFVFVAGVKALFIGLVIILLTSFIGSFSNTHFDGVLDVHQGLKVPIYIFPVEGMIDWLALSAVLLIFGCIFSRSAVRAIDIFGTQALARWPHLITAVVLLPPGCLRYTQHTVYQAAKIGQEVATKPTDIYFFIVAIIVLLIMIVWVVALMYKAYSVSCNLKGAKVVVTFIIALIISEALSKFALFVLYKALGVDMAKFTETISH